MTQLARYVAAWREHDLDGVLATLTENCVVIESHGPTYVGKDQVRRWITTWLAAGGVVTHWDITSQASFEGGLVAEWSFGCVWQGETYDIDGITIARLEDGKMCHLREYATTAPLYEWTGTWR